MGVHSQSALIAALILLGLSINVLFERRRVEHRVAFASLVSAFALFNLSWFFNSLTTSTFWLTLLLFSAVAIAQTSLSFFERVLQQSMSTVRTIATTASAVVVCLALTDLAQDAFVAAGASLLAVGVYGWCIWRLYERFKATEDPVESTRLSYLVFGGVISIVLSVIDLLPALELPSPALGHVWTTVYMYFWMQVILRSRLLDLKELLGRGLELLILSSFISLIYAALLVWVDNSLGLFFFNTIAASVLLFFVFEPLKRVVDVWVGRLLFRSTHELEAAIEALDRTLGTVSDLEHLLERVIRSLQESRRVTHASVFILESSGTAYSIPTPAARLGELETQRLDVVSGRAYLDALLRERVVSLESVRRDLLDLQEDPVDTPHHAQLNEIHSTLLQMSAGLSFAFTSGDRLVGFLNVKDDRSEEAFSTYEISLISGITAQITRALENSELVREIKERDRLSSLGEMATGMAHEIRNPLGAIKSAAQLLEPPENDSEAASLYNVIVDEANRLDLVLSQFLSFARPFRGELQPVQITEILSRVGTLVRAEEHGGRIKVEVNASDDLPYVVGDPDQLHQVCLNLARNACQAMDTKGGTLRLEAGLIKEDVPARPGQFRRRIQVRVQDTGAGMSDEALQNLFIPFYTTKRSGTGLGLPISQRLLQHHGSEIKVDSTAHGTTMSFHLILEEDAEQLTGEHRRLLSLGGP